MSSEALYARNRTPCCQPPIQQTAVANQCQALVSAPRADSSARQSVHSMCMLKHLKKGGGGGIKEPCGPGWLGLRREIRRACGQDDF